MCSLMCYTVKNSYSVVVNSCRSCICSNFANIFLENISLSVRKETYWKYKKLSENIGKNKLRPEEI
jgi:hypothetical protein